MLVKRNLNGKQLQQLPESANTLLSPRRSGEIDQTVFQNRGSDFFHKSISHFSSENK